MKRLLLTMLTMALIACQSRTEYGECVGLIDDSKDPNLVYRVSIRNAVLGGLFFGTIFVPVIVIATEFQCPVARR